MTVRVKRWWLPPAAGVAGALLLTGLYFGLISLAMPRDALSLFRADRAFVIPLVLGFGVQVGLFTYLRAGLFVSGGAAGAGTAANGGVSTAAMVACCAHHLADALPLVGLTAAATFLAQWKTPFMVLGLVSNAAGIALLLRQIAAARRHARACQVTAMEAAS